LERGEATLELPKLKNRESQIQKPCGFVFFRFRAITAMSAIPLVFQFWQLPDFGNFGNLTPDSGPNQPFDWLKSTIPLAEVWLSPSKISTYCGEKWPDTCTTLLLNPQLCAGLALGPYLLRRRP